MKIMQGLYEEFKLLNEAGQEPIDLGADVKSSFKKYTGIDLKFKFVGVRKDRFLEIFKYTYTLLPTDFGIFKVIFKNATINVNAYKIEGKWQINAELLWTNNAHGLNGADIFLDGKRTNYL